MCYVGNWVMYMDIGTSEETFSQILHNWGKDHVTVYYGICHVYDFFLLSGSVAAIFGYVYNIR